MLSPLCSSFCHARKKAQREQLISIHASFCQVGVFYLCFQMWRCLNPKHLRHNVSIFLYFCQNYIDNGSGTGRDKKKITHVMRVNAPKPHMIMTLSVRFIIRGKLVIWPDAGLNLALLIVVGSSISVFYIWLSEFD